MKLNYQKKMTEIVNDLREAGRTPRLLLHSCCAPCSSYVLEYLSPDFEIVDFFYNPNITEREEYRKRSEELRRLIGEMPHHHGVTFLEGDFEPDAFFEAVRGLEEEPEGGERCRKCFALRLTKAAEAAEKNNCEFLTTSLTISPLKNAAWLNETGEEACAGRKVKWLPSDFKKKGGYQRSLELSREYGLYRQDYCGCIFSKRERQTRKEVLKEGGGCRDLTDGAEKPGCHMHRDEL